MIKNKKNTANLFFTTFLLLVLNLHSKHLSIEITDYQKSILKKPIFRDILIFLISYTTSENIFLAILITLLYAICFDHILNEESKIGNFFFLNNRYNGRTNEYNRYKQINRNL